MQIATHDGTFHADETVACAILTYLYDKSPRVLRSRDPIKLESADLIIDVSGKNDHRHFDHHSKEFNLSRDNGIRYATAGLMWLKFGMDYLKKVISNRDLFPQKVADTILERARLRIDREIMELVDLNDNGQLTEYLDTLADAKTDSEQAVLARLNTFYQSVPDLPYLVAMQNVSGLSADEQQRAFDKTVDMLRLVILNCATNAIITELGIAKVIELYQGGEILYMHEHFPWSQAVLDYPEYFKDCKLAVYPDRKGRWRVQSLPVSKALRFKNRLSAPPAWRGLNDEDLDRVTGLKHTTFVHRAGFTGGAETYEDNVALAKLWLQEGVSD